MDILDRLAKSKFRSRFKLREKELEYIKEKGLDKICSHACDFIRDRVGRLGIPAQQLEKFSFHLTQFLKV